MTFQACNPLRHSGRLNERLPLYTGEWNRIDALEIDRHTIFLINGV
jgi:hypothetical protein